MELVPSDPFTPIHEEILEQLAGGRIYYCMDPDERWAPYLQGMIDAGWLKEIPPPDRSLLHLTGVKITEAGLSVREVLRVRGTL